VLPIAAGASPSRPVDDDAFEHIAGKICEAAAQGRRGGGFDGILLDLHGAMVTESFEDGEGELLRRLRAIDPKTPIAVAYDMHANLYDAMIDNATVVAGYRTYPHVDTYETARRAGDILLRAIRGEVHPVIAWGNVPMLPHVMRQGSDDHPNRELQERCAAMSGEGALAASLFTGFPHADIANAGLSAVVVTDGDQTLAERLRDELLDRAWADREAFVYKIEPLAAALTRAKAMPEPRPGEGPIVLLDHYDNCASGGTMDTTIVLGEIIKAGLDNVAAFAIYDPEAVQRAIAAGIGAQVTLSVGGKLAMPQIPGDSLPLTIAGTVRTMSNGRFRNKGPMGRGVLTDMGPSVVIDTGKVEVALISRHVEPSDLNCFYSLGIDPLQKRYVMLKSRVHWRAGLGAMAKAVVDCAGIGVCTSDYSQLTFKNVRRPIYPLDLPNR
jgi:microcystin degradation protein MlrC